MTERLIQIKYNGIVSRKREETGISCSTYCDLCSQGGGNCEYVSEMIKKLAEYETAEEEGRLLFLPCKVGDKVYIIDDIDYSYERDSVVTGIDIDKYGVSIMIQDESPVSSSGYDISDFGETIFLSKENALKKLKELMQDE